MSKLFIIGNGFDIASGLQTGYKDFRKWFIENHDLDYSCLDRIAKEESFSDIQIPSASLGQHGEDMYDEENLATFFYVSVTYANSDDITWNDFEANLSKLPFYGFEDSNFCDSDDEWKRIATAEQVGSILGNAFIYTINKYFTDWIRYIHTYERPIHIKKLVFDNLNSTFLNFNYTNVLEYLYKIPDEQICHIHGYVGKGDEIVIGHGNKESYASDFNPYDISSYAIEAKEYLKKPVKDIIFKNSSFFQKLGQLEEIYIIGWGLNNPDFVDAPYLQEVIKHTNLSTTIYFDSFDLSKLDIYKNTCRKNGFKGLFGISNSDTAYKYLI